MPNQLNSRIGIFRKNMPFLHNCNDWISIKCKFPPLWLCGYPVLFWLVWRRLEFAFLCAGFGRRIFYFFRKFFIMEKIDWKIAEQRKWFKFFLYIPIILAVIYAIPRFISVIMEAFESHEPAYLWELFLIGFRTLLIYALLKIFLSYRILHIAYLEKIENHVVREDSEQKKVIFGKIENPIIREEVGQENAVGGQTKGLGKFRRKWKMLDEETRTGILGIILAGVVILAIVTILSFVI